MIRTGIAPIGSWDSLQNRGMSSSYNIIKHNDQVSSDSWWPFQGFLAVEDTEGVDDSLLLGPTQRRDGAAGPRPPKLALSP